nr:ribonuclease H-like domain-containing protein [Tanacetum cinerariifolium]
MADNEVLTNMALMDFSDSEMAQKPVLKTVEKGTGQREVRPVWNNAMRVNHQNFSNCRRNFSPTTVLTKSRIVSISTARQSSSRAATQVSTARPINTAVPKPIVNVAKTRQNAFQKTLSLSRRHFHQQTTLKNRYLVNTTKVKYVNTVNTAKGKSVTSAVGKQGTNAVKSSACWVWRPKIKVQDHVFKNSESYICKRFDYVDPEGRLNGCSRHMTGNKSFLPGHQEYDGGFVAFTCSSKEGKITGKGKIRTEKLDFEDVYFVKELKFNLFSVSQMCDKKNIVLFTKTECLILSPAFKLPDENQVLLKVPRKNNMYIFDLKNVVPLKGLTCLFAKATNDESNLWHRRLEGKVAQSLLCDNRTEFKNYKMNQFCGIKGIKREFSNARTPQQNGVAERKNMTLIEAARTMLADSLLPIPFWAEAVNTACYVQNRVLVTKPHNKTPYELLIGRVPIISFMRPFGCPVTILNTLDHLGKFDGKADEGFLVGYSINSKAFRVYNSRTKKVEKNLHVNFLENKPNVTGSGIEWLFDIDSLTNLMNYQPVNARNRINGIAGSKIHSDAGQEGKEKVYDQESILLPVVNTSSDVPLSNEEVVSSPKDDAGKKLTVEPTCVKGGKIDDLGCLDQQMKSTDDSENTNNTNSFNTASLTVNTASDKDRTVIKNTRYSTIQTPTRIPQTRKPHSAEPNTNQINTRDEMN